MAVTLVATTKMGEWHISKGDTTLCGDFVPDFRETIAALPDDKTYLCKKCLALFEEGRVITEATK